MICACAPPLSVVYPATESPIFSPVRGVGQDRHGVGCPRHYVGMPLTLVLGPANSAKAGEVFGAFGTAAHRGALLVVPNASDAEHYSRELAEQGSVLASVLTFSGLIEELARRTGYAERRLTARQ